MRFGQPHQLMQKNLRAVLVNHTNLCKEIIDQFWPYKTTYAKKLLISFGQPHKFMQRQCWSVQQMQRNYWSVLVIHTNLCKKTVDQVWSTTAIYAKKLLISLINHPDFRNVTVNRIWSTISTYANKL